MYQLQRLGYRVDLRPVEFINYCVIEMYGYEIFRCNIKNLKFNTPCCLDVICQRAIAAVEHASEKFQRASDYYWLRHLVEESITITKNRLMPESYWPGEVTLKSFNMCADCVKCCDALVAKKLEEANLHTNLD